MCVMLSRMAAPEQAENARLSGQLQALGQRHFRELPHATASLVLTVNEGRVLVEAYDRLGRKLGEIPNEMTSSAFASELHDVFGQVALPAGENVMAPVSNPMRAQTS